MKFTTKNTVLHDLMWLWLELERQPNAQSMRDILNEPLNNQKYRNVVDYGGKEFLTWLAKMMITMKEETNGTNHNNTNG
jgi:hypothetical protein